MPKNLDKRFIIRLRFMFEFFQQLLDNNPEIPGFLNRL
jgi:hypothetical protein